MKERTKSSSGVLTFSGYTERNEHRERIMTAEVMYCIVEYGAWLRSRRLGSWVGLGIVNRAHLSSLGVLWYGAAGPSTARRLFQADGAVDMQLLSQGEASQAKGKGEYNP